MMIASRVNLPSDQDASGRTFGAEELAAVRDVLDSGVLTSTKGNAVKSFETAFAGLIGSKFAYACTSGTTAVHLAIAALVTEPGDEIVTTSITDMGAISPILYQGAIPVFADVDPRTLNVSAETVAAVLTERTKAIIVTHLFGNPAPIKEICALAKSRGIPVIEDTAQALLATVDGKNVGTFGSIGCFSLQQGKHITTGEGGVVVTDDPALARMLFLGINKAWGYGDANADHYFLALNGRMSELQGAVAGAQLNRLTEVVADRRTTATAFLDEIADVAGVEATYVAPGAEPAWWKVALLVDETIIPGGTQALAAALKAYGIASAPRYIVKPAFACEVIRDQKTFGTSRWPFTLARPEALDYRPERFPGTYRGLEQVLVLPWNERYEAEHVDAIVACLKTSVRTLRGQLTAVR